MVSAAPPASTRADSHPACARWCRASSRACSGTKARVHHVGERLAPPQLERGAEAADRGGRIVERPAVGLAAELLEAHQVDRLRGDVEPVAHRLPDDRADAEHAAQTRT